MGNSSLLSEQTLLRGVVVSQSTNKPDRLHFGCGNLTPSSWLNMDGSWSLMLAKRPLLFKVLSGLRILPRHVRDRTYNPDVFIHNLRRPLPFADGTFSAVFSSHTLEHLYLSDTTRLLRECHRVLKPGGAARMVVPDLGSLVREYLGQIVIPGFEFDFQPATNADRFMRNMLVRPWAPPKSGLLYRAFSAFTDLHSHKWMFDGDSLSYHMRQAGFVDVGVRSFRESRIQGIEEVEIAERVLDGRGVCVEGIKPSDTGR